MKDIGVTILPVKDGYLVQVAGRANFDYAVPLRDLSNNLSGMEAICIDLSSCTAMDSTFMGVLSMLGLRSRRRCKTVEIAGAADNLRFLLRGLGVEKLFHFIPAPRTPADGNETPQQTSEADLRAKAQTVLEAHKALVEADASNAERFKSVIEYADEDVKRLDSEQ